MSNQSTKTTFRPGGFISERATRGVLNQPADINRG